MVSFIIPVLLYPCYPLHRRLDGSQNLAGGAKGFLIKWNIFRESNPEAGVRFPALPKKKVVGLEWYPLSLLSITEELLDRKVAAPV
jgi:hypothetical protein